jgi:hypothetical protein
MKTKWLSLYHDHDTELGLRLLWLCNWDKRAVLFLLFNPSRSHDEFHLTCEKSYSSPTVP